MNYHKFACQFVCDWMEGQNWIWNSWEVGCAWVSVWNHGGGCAWMGVWDRGGGCEWMKVREKRVGWGG
jgi:hypothetical protein